jgi:hypothetical protein
MNPQASVSFFDVLHLMGHRRGDSEPRELSRSLRIFLNHAILTRGTCSGACQHDHGMSSVGLISGVTLKYAQTWRIRNRSRRQDSVDGWILSTHANWRSFGTTLLGKSSKFQLEGGMRYWKANIESRWRCSNVISYQ